MKRFIRKYIKPSNANNIRQCVTFVDGSCFLESLLTLHPCQSRANFMTHYRLKLIFCSLFQPNKASASCRVFNLTIRGNGCFSQHGDWINVKQSLSNDAKRNLIKMSFRSWSETRASCKVDQKILQQRGLV